MSLVASSRGGAALSASVARRARSLDMATARRSFVSLSAVKRIVTTQGSGGGTQPGQTPGNEQSTIGYLAGVFASLMPKSMPFTGTPAPPVPPPHVRAVEKQVKMSPVEKVLVRRPSRSEVTGRTRALVKKFLAATSTESQIFRLQELSAHLSAFPPTRIVAVQEPRLISRLLELEQCPHPSDTRVSEEARMCLALCGHQPETKAAGISLLSIDGGGTRGMMGLEVLEALEKASGKKIYELFDHITGVSTGSIIASLLGARQMSVGEARSIYMDVSRQLFNQSKISGVSGLLLSHSYYNTKKWTAILREIIGDEFECIHSARTRGVPRVAIVASIVNLPVLAPYIFRNYSAPAGRDSHYRGSSHHYLWQAVQASAAAPGYFEEVALRNLLLQDGGVIANNPSAIAIHEARLLWPRDTIHCVVSVGNGRCVQELQTPHKEHDVDDAAKSAMATGVSAKISKIIDSATDTEAVHMHSHDLLSERQYFRLNPYMSYPYGLDEIDPDRLEQMSHDAKLYVRRNKRKIEQCAKRLLERPSQLQKVKRAINRLRDRHGMYSPE